MAEKGEGVIVGIYLLKINSSEIRNRLVREIEKYVYSERNRV